MSAMRSGSRSAVLAIGRIRSAVPLHDERGHVDLGQVVAEVVVDLDR
jgi:hypothetical protein